MTLNLKKINFIVSISSFFLVFLAVYLQEKFFLDPCPLCIIQRYLYIIIALISFFFFIQNPKEKTRYLYFFLILFTILIGIFVSGRQIFLQYYPPDLYNCGADLFYLIETVPLSGLFPQIFAGTGDCSLVDWSFLSFSLAELSFACFVFLGIFYLTILIKTIKNNSSSQIISP